jgi:hypothetical protein
LLGKDSRGLLIEKHLRRGQSALPFFIDVEYAYECGLSLLLAAQGKLVNESSQEFQYQRLEKTQGY